MLTATQSSEEHVANGTGEDPKQIATCEDQMQLCH
jgi:hypothetical protein